MIFEDNFFETEINQVETSERNPRAKPLQKINQTAFDQIEKGKCIYWEGNHGCSGLFKDEGDSKKGLENKSSKLTIAETISLLQGEEESSFKQDDKISMFELNGPGLSYNKKDISKDDYNSWK